MSLNINKITEIIRDQNTLKSMIKELLNVDHGLYDNEIEFLESVSKQTFEISEGQANWLTKIYRRIMR